MNKVDTRIQVTQAPVDEMVPFASIGSLDPYARLMAAILAQSVEDVKLGHIDAAFWLLGDEAASYFEALNLDRRRIHDFIESKFPHDRWQ